MLQLIELDRILQVDINSTKFRCLEYREERSFTSLFTVWVLHQLEGFRLVNWDPGYHGTFLILNKLRNNISCLPSKIG